jgi:hypothetical protein
MVQPNIKFASLQEQSLLYSHIPDDDSIDYHDVTVVQGSPEELVTAIVAFVTSAEKVGVLEMVYRFCESR